MLTMGEGALILELAFASQLPISAHLSLEFHLVLPDEILSFLLSVEMLLRLLNSCHFVSTF
jgi:hypothetical protein